MEYLQAISPEFFVQSKNKLLEILLNFSIVKIGMDLRVE